MHFSQKHDLKIRFREEVNSFKNLVLYLMDISKNVLKRVNIRFFYIDIVRNLMADSYGLVRFIYDFYFVITNTNIILNKNIVEMWYITSKIWNFINRVHLFTDSLCLISIIWFNVEMRLKYFWSTHLNTSPFRPPFN